MRFRRCRFRALSFGLALLLSAATLLAQNPPSSAYTRGRAAYDSGKYAEAAELFRAAAQQPAAPPDSLLWEAKSLADTGSFPAAEQALTRYLATGEHSATALYLLGYVQQRQNHPRDSLATFTRAAAVRTPNAEDLRLVAIDYVLLDDYRDARTWLNRALGMNPHLTEARYDLGRVAMHDGDFHAAERQFQAVLAADPASVKAMNNLGVTYEALNRPADALAIYARAVTAQAGAAHPSEQPLLNQGALLITQGRPAEAVPPLRQSVAIAPGCSHCHEELARALLATGSAEAARSEMAAAVRLDPSNPRLHFQLGQMLRRAGLEREAAAELRKSESLYGTKSSVPNP